MRHGGWSVGCLTAKRPVVEHALPSTCQLSSRLEATNQKIITSNFLFQSRTDHSLIFTGIARWLVDDYCVLKVSVRFQYWFLISPWLNFASGEHPCVCSYIREITNVCFRITSKCLSDEEHSGWRGVHLKKTSLMSCNFLKAIDLWSFFVVFNWLVC